MSLGKVCDGTQGKPSSSGAPEVQEGLKAQSLSKQVAETEAAGLTSWLSHHLALSGTTVGLPRGMENLEKWGGKKQTPGK